MEDMEKTLNSILSNPETMSQIMAMAQSFGQSTPEQKEVPATESPAPFSLPSGMDMQMLQTISGIASNSGIDRNQRALLQALSPYLSESRLHKLEKAMRASKIAGLATDFLGDGKFQQILGR